MNQSIVLAHSPRSEVILPDARGEIAWVVTRDVDQLQEWWDDCRDRWLNKKRRSEKSNTRSAYMTAWKGFYHFVDAYPPDGVHLWEVHPGHVNDWVQDMVDEDLSRATINLRLAALSSYYEYAARFYYVPGTIPPITLWSVTQEGISTQRVNPFKSVERFSLGERARRPFPTQAECDRLWEAIKLNNPQAWRDMALLYGCWYTTRRSDEWISLRWGDIHEGQQNHLFYYTCKGGELKEQVMPQPVYDIIVRSLQEAGRWPIGDDEYVFVDLSQRIKRMRKSAKIEMPGDGTVVRWHKDIDDVVEADRAVVEVEIGDIRTILYAPIAGQVRTLLAEVGACVEAGKPLCKIVGEPMVGEDYRPGLKPMTNHTFNQLLQKYGRRAMIADEKLHVHGLRHAGARYRYLVEGATVGEMREILGHSNDSITWRYISKTLMEPEDRLADVIFDKTAPRQLKMRLKA